MYTQQSCGTCQLMHNGDCDGDRQSVRGAQCDDYHAMCVVESCPVCKDQCCEACHLWAAVRSSRCA